MATKIKGPAKTMHKLHSKHRAHKGKRCPNCGGRMAVGVENYHRGCGWAA
jgi:PHP family Zn ribbon phosphoesterase